MTAFKNTLIVGFSAIGLADLTDMEKYYIQNTWNFKVHDTHIGTDIDIANVTRCTFRAFIDTSTGRAKLVVASTEKREQLRAESTGDLEVLDNPTSREQLRGLTSRHLVFITDFDLLRGFDYRCETGINLFIASKVTSQRQLLQALGRVGRYTDDQFARFADTALQGELYDTGHEIERS